MIQPPLLVTVTDYPDSIILGNLQRNVTRNAPVFGRCLVECTGYAWGTDPEPLL